MNTESPRLPYDDTPVLKGSTWYSYGPRVEEDGHSIPCAYEDDAEYWSTYVWKGDHWVHLSDWETKDDAMSNIHSRSDAA